MKLDLSLLDKDVQNKIYDDLLHGPLQNCGQALEVLSEFISSPLYYLRLINIKQRRRFERTISEFEKKLSSAHADKITTPPSEIAEPILDQLAKVDDELLSKLFIELLSKSSINAAENKIHRAFPETLSQIVPDEARIIQHYAENRYIPFVRFMHNELLPLSDRYTEVSNVVSLSIPNSITLYLENLVRIGVLACRDNLIFHGSEKHYQQLVQDGTEEGINVCYRYDAQEPFKNKGAPFWLRGHYAYTTYGEKFRAACCHEIKY